MTNLADDPGLMDPKVNQLIPEAEPGEDLGLEAEIAADPPAAEEDDENDLIPVSEASRAALISRIENSFASGLGDDVDLGDGTCLWRAASGQLVVSQGGWTLAVERASFRLLSRIAARLDR